MTARRTRSALGAMLPYPACYGRTVLNKLAGLTRFRSLS